MRIRLIQKLIDAHEPRFVVMYGTTYRERWEQVCGSELARHPDLGLSHGKRGRTEMLVIKHPAAKGVTNAYFDSIGLYLQRAKA
jgi:hypothetical protein